MTLAATEHSIDAAKGQRVSPVIPGHRAESESHAAEILGNAADAPPSLPWPRKYDVFGVRVSATCYAEAVDHIIAAARRGEGRIVDLIPVHGVVVAARDGEHRSRINAFDLVAPDGQPVRWCLNWMHGAGLTDRVYGPELTARVCAAAAAAGVGVYLYGSTDDVLAKLSANLRRRFPGLVIAGTESPPFRPLTPQEDQAVVERINRSGAGILLVGIGCPKQEVFAYNHRHSIRAVQLCVGAAFDFHAGVKKIAPPWMQRRGLEWLFRLCQEPRRLWKRYAVYNSLFLFLVARHFLIRRPAPVGDGLVDLTS